MLQVRDMNKIRRAGSICISLLLYLSVALISPVEASYILPYPSYMPGSKLYTISRTADRIKAYWYFGDIGKIRYHMALSDKYLVEAKTLFEYKQYLLAVDALSRSDWEFLRIPDNLLLAKKHGKDVDYLVGIYRDEARSHMDIINRILLDTPETFLWEPEKEEANLLMIHKYLQIAADVRKRATQSALPL